MNKLFQKDWHRISFSSFTTLSSKKLPDAQFYERFYSVLFNRYPEPSLLANEWLALKRSVSENIQAHDLKNKDAAILSVGCGLGIIEMDLLKEGYRRLEIAETSVTPLRWIAPLLPAENIHIGSYPACIPADRTYENVLFISIDYSWDQIEFIAALEHARRLLSESGQCIVVSHTIEQLRWNERIIKKLKGALYFIFEKLNYRQRGQFWGYNRNMSDYEEAFKAAGFSSTEHRWIKTSTPWATFCMVGYLERKT